MAYCLTTPSHYLYQCLTHQKMCPVVFNWNKWSRTCWTCSEIVFGTLCVGLYLTDFVMRLPRMMRHYRQTNMANTNIIMTSGEQAWTIITTHFDWIDFIKSHQWSVIITWQNSKNFCAVWFVGMFLYSFAWVVVRLSHSRHRNLRMACQITAKFIPKRIRIQVPLNSLIINQTTGRKWIIIDTFDR